MDTGKFPEFFADPFRHDLYSNAALGNVYIELAMPRIHLLLRFTALVPLLMFAAAVLSAQEPPPKLDIPAWKPIFRGVELVRFTATSPRPLHLAAARIDLREPGIRFLVTPPKGEKLHEVAGLKTTTFLEKYKCQLVINASAFSPKVTHEGDTQRVFGLALSEGRVYSPAGKSSHSALVITRDNHARIARPPIDITGAFNAAGGLGDLLNAGAVVVGGSGGSGGSGVPGAGARILSRAPPWEFPAMGDISFFWSSMAGSLITAKDAAWLKRRCGSSRWAVGTRSTWTAAAQHRWRWRMGKAKPSFSTSRSTCTCPTGSGSAAATWVCSLYSWAQEHRRKKLLNQGLVAYAIIQAGLFRGYLQRITDR